MPVHPTGLLASSDAIAKGAIHRWIFSVAIEQHAYLATAIEIMRKYSSPLLTGLCSAMQTKLLTANLFDALISLSRPLCRVFALRFS